MPLDSKTAPENPIVLPDDKKKLLKTAQDVIEACMTSAGIRSAYCRQLTAIIETGKQDGSRSLINLLYKHHDRLTAHLFSPTELTFRVDFEQDYEEKILERGNRVAKLLTRDFERTNSDLVFGDGVFTALEYGATIFKQWAQQEPGKDHATNCAGLLMPWQFGVYREDYNDLDRQPAMCEVTTLTLPEVWKRIAHMPDAHGLFNRVKGHATRGGTGGTANTSFFHQVLSTGTLNTGVQQNSRPMPGGIVQLNNDPNYSIMGPQMDVNLIKLYELWVWGQDGYETIQLIEPDILIHPRFKRGNLLLGANGAEVHPYTLIQPNKTHGYFWGRPEVADLIEPQALLSQWAEDGKRLFGLQIDKIIAFKGENDITDENYDQFRAAGYFNMGPNGAVQDLTPQMPPNFNEQLNMLIKIIDMIGGFDNILSGKGESGVRAGQHANTLLKTASPSLRDRSLLVERQCAQAADTRLSIMEAKDGRKFWTDPKNQDETSFLLSDLPDDRRVTVDSHSSSPIFADDHQQLIAFGLKAGFVDGESAIELLPYPQKDLLKQRFRKRQEAQQAMVQKLMQTDPEAAAKMLSGRRR